MMCIYIYIYLVICLFIIAGKHGLVQEKLVKLFLFFPKAFPHKYINLRKIYIYIYNRPYP